MTREESVTRAYVAFGGNIGANAEILARFADALVHLKSVARVVATSPVYSSAPQGPVVDQPAFLNAVVGVEPAGPAEWMLDNLLEIERAFGRQRQSAGGPRTLDLDLLAYGQQTMSSDRLTLPHPRALGRAFVLVPWRDVAGADYEVPGTGRLLEELVSRLGAEPGVRLHAQFPFAK